MLISEYSNLPIVRQKIWKRSYKKKFYWAFVPYRSGSIVLELRIRITDRIQLTALPALDVDLRGQLFLLYGGVLHTVLHVGQEWGYTRHYPGPKSEVKWKTTKIKYRGIFKALCLKLCTLSMVVYCILSFMLDRSGVIPDITRVLNQW